MVETASSSCGSSGDPGFTAVGRNKQGKQEERETQRTGKEEVETTVVSEVLSYISPVFPLVLVSFKYRLRTVCAFIQTKENSLNLFYGLLKI